MAESIDMLHIRSMETATPLDATPQACASAWGC
jgi:hypothetical protein